MISPWYVDSILGYLFFLTNIRIPQPMSRPFTAMTGNRKYYLCVYGKKKAPHLTQSQGNHFDRLLAVSGARGEWPTISNIEPQRIPVRHRLPNQSIICLFPIRIPSDEKQFETYEAGYAKSSYIRS